MAWRYSTGEFPKPVGEGRPPRLGATPIVVEGRMYFSTATGRVLALDAATGRELWRFDARVDRTAGYGDFVSRGVSWWRDARARPRSRCAARIVAPIIDGRLIALDAGDGRPCEGFGAGGTVDLRQGLRNPPTEPSEFELTSPPAVVGDVIVMGSAVADNGRIDAASGEVRGLDARTGRVLWSWDPVPQDSTDPAYAGWRGPEAHRVGGANTWSVIAADPRRGLVFLPTSSPHVDYWGGARLGANAYGNALVALAARTGRRVWSFQTIHHDLWDYDNAAPPALVEVTVGGRRRAAVLQATKSGQLFVLDRDTGRPLFPVEERPVPASDAQGEQASATQPFSALPPLSPLSLTAADLERDIADPDFRKRCLAALGELRNEGPFTPPSERGSLQMPSNIGGAHWGGVAYDPVSQTVFVPTNRIAAAVRLIPRERPEASRRYNGGSGERLGGERLGGERLGLEYAPMRGSPYVLRREFFAVGGRPCTPPPYGTLHAISLAARRTLWNRPLGTGEGLPFGPVDGMVNLGGPITTAAGLIFIGGTPDAYLRAFDQRDGREIWKARLPAGARATPMTYGGGDGRQYVAIAAGGDGELFGSGDEIVAFALPREGAR